MDSFKVSKVVDCKLERIMDLGWKFSFKRVACGTYNIQNEEKVMLCFEKDFAKRCVW